MSRSNCGSVPLPDSGTASAATRGCGSTPSTSTSRTSESRPARRPVAPSSRTFTSIRPSAFRGGFARARRARDRPAPLRPERRRGCSRRRWRPCPAFRSSAGTGAVGDDAEEVPQGRGDAGDDGVDPTDDPDRRCLLAFDEPDRAGEHGDEGLDRVTRFRKSSGEMRCPRVKTVLSGQGQLRSLSLSGWAGVVDEDVAGAGVEPRRTDRYRSRPTSVPTSTMMVWVIHVARSSAGPGASTSTRRWSAPCGCSGSRDTKVRASPI